MRRRFAAVPVAVLGMLAAHTLAYRIVSPTAGHRDDLLAMTGHGWSALVPLVIGTTLLSVIVGSWQRAAGRGQSVRLAEVLVAQTSLYTFVEVIERAAHGAPLWPGAQLLIAGMLVQLPVAMVIWSVLRYVVDPVVAAVRNCFSSLEVEGLEALGFQVIVSFFVSPPSRATAGRSPPLFV